MGNHNFGENLMPDPTDKRIEELWQYIPPYTAPNHPPQVKVITTTNTGDTPMTEEDPDLLAGDNLDRLRGRNLTEELENARYQNNLLTEKCRELEARNKSLKEGFEGGCHLCEVVAENSNRVRESYIAAWALNEELEKKIERLQEENRQLREPSNDHLQDLG